MKTIIILFFTFIFSCFSFSQPLGINYKAIVRDGGGHVLANKPITVQFTILQGVVLTYVYEETHTTTTNDIGMVIVSIGDGTLVTGVFPYIEWGSNEYLLNTKIDTGSGLTDMGTIEFKTVPYGFLTKTVGKSLSGE